MTLAIVAGDGITLTPLAAALSFAPVLVVAAVAVGDLRAISPDPRRRTGGSELPARDDAPNSLSLDRRLAEFVTETLSRRRLRRPR